MNEVPRQVMLVEMVQVEVSEVVVGDSLGKHVIDRHQDFVGDRHGRPLVPAPRVCYESRSPDRW